MNLADIERIDDPESFILDPGLVVYLPLHQLDGDSFISKDKHGHLCTVTGATWGIQGRSADGDDIIDCGNNAALQIIGAFTLWTWFKPTLADNLQPLISKDGEAGDRGWYINVLGTSDIVRALVSPDGTAVSYFTTTATLTDATWILLFAVYIPSTSLSIYFNDGAAEAGTQTGAVPASINDSSSNLFLLGDNRVAPSFANGVMGEAGICNRALTAGERKQIYLATKWRYR